MTITTDNRREKRPAAFTAKGRRIISVDGEGNDIDGRHSYTLLCAADDRNTVRQHLEHDGSRREAVNGAWEWVSVSGRTFNGTTYRQANYGLPTKRILDWLLDVCPNPAGDLTVAFSFVYDAVKILTDLDGPSLAELKATEKVEWEGYLIQYRPRKYFSVAQPRYGKVRSADGRYRYRKQCKVWDAFGYFQSSFVKALKGTQSGVFTPEELVMIPTIEEMKRNRSHFEDVPKEEILSYCFSEVEMLSKMMRAVIVGTEELDIFPHSFHGSSAIAATWMEDKAIHTYTGDAGIPEEIIRGGYYGGRFESCGVGTIGDAYSYDIRSAYPAEMVTLPCLAHATARRVTEYEPGEIGVYLVGSRTAGTFAPFPIRVDKEAAGFINQRRLTDKKYDGMSPWLKALYNRQVLFAHGGKRWVWSPEVEVARRHFGADSIPVYDGYVIDIGCDHQPFADVQSLYDTRAIMKANHDGRQMVLKLLINSLYGKTAQSIGFNPKFLCRIWAGLITSGTRAKVLHAALTSDAVISIATDGIVTSKPLSTEHGIAISERLGDWEYSLYRSFEIYQNGIYAFETAGKGGQWEPTFKTRGFSRQDITSEMLHDAWLNGEWEVYPAGDARAYIPLHQAMGRKDPLNLMGQWISQKRAVSFHVSKREIDPRYVSPLTFHERPEYMNTNAITLPDDVMGLAYIPHSAFDDVRELADLIGDEAGYGDGDELPIIDESELTLFDEMGDPA